MRGKGVTRKTWLLADEWRCDDDDEVVVGGRQCSCDGCVEGEVIRVSEKAVSEARTKRDNEIWTVRGHNAIFLKLPKTPRSCGTRIPLRNACKQTFEHVDICERDRNDV